MKTSFSKIKKEILKRASEHTTSCSQYVKASTAKTEALFWEVVKDNASWCYERNVITVEMLLAYDHKKLNKHGIIVSGEHSITSGTYIILGGTVNYIRGGTVNDIRGGTVNDISGGTVNYISGGTVNDISGGTVNYISGGTVNYIRGGTVNYISGGTVNYIRGGTVNDIRGGTVNYISGGTVNDISGGTVCNADYYFDRIKKVNGGVIICPSQGKIYIQKNKFEIVQL